MKCTKTIIQVFVKKRIHYKNDNFCEPYNSIKALLQLYPSVSFSFSDINPA